MRWLIPLLFLTACSSGFNSVNHYLAKRGLEPPTAGKFQTCRGYGCQIVDVIELTDKEWKTIEKPFRKKAKSAEDEREQIIKSIATFESIVGEINGTSEDIWGTFQKTGYKQQDCVDESTNTSIYLLALKQRGHLKFHDIHVPQSRVPFMRWPHQTAVIIEKETGAKYAVDSWFHNNGAPPEIIELGIWKKGWKPDKEKP